MFQHCLNSRAGSILALLSMRKNYLSIALLANGAAKCGLECWLRFVEQHPVTY